MFSNLILNSVYWHFRKNGKDVAGTPPPFCTLRQLIFYVYSLNYSAFKYATSRAGYSVPMTVQNMTVEAIYEYQRIPRT